jgi:hypothetical protein
MSRCAPGDFAAALGSSLILQKRPGFQRTPSAFQPIKTARLGLCLARAFGWLLVLLGVALAVALLLFPLGPGAAQAPAFSLAAPSDRPDTRGVWLTLNAMAVLRDRQRMQASVAELAHLNFNTLYLVMGTAARPGIPVRWRSGGDHGGPAQPAGAHQSRHRPGGGRPRTWPGGGVLFSKPSGSAARSRRRARPGCQLDDSQRLTSEQQLV